MPNILKIDQFQKDFKSKYGLDADGSCYLVKSPFYLEIISAYDREDKKSNHISKVKPVWTRINTQDGDVISVTASGCFIQLNDYTGFIECRPENLSNEEEPKFDKFPNDMLKKIGKDIIDSKPMSFEERSKITIARA